MELHIQKCQQCGSRASRDILVRDEKQKVYVQCQQCGALVARYILSSGGYFHAGKGFESFLRSIERDGGSSSGRDMQQTFHSVESAALAEFEQVKKWMEEKYGNKPPQ